MNNLVLKPVNSAVIIGSSSGIANAIVDELIEDVDIEQIITISQNENSNLSGNHGNDINHVHKVCNYSAQSIANVCQDLSSIKGYLVKVFICNGRLHSVNTEDETAISPEKRLEEINPESMQALFHSNAIVPMLWLQQLATVVNSKQNCVISVLSARVGSISDNHLGGWYSYRASKAALNMLLKTTAIEYARRAKNVKLIAFHPGTTDTELSKPFQANVPEGKLFTAGFVAKQLMKTHQQLVFDCKAEFLDWQGKTINW
ncbi:SDR family NAD(P)-dependent oxidoreductase [Shewanella sp. KT0246]|uniref:SDR family NAD(P)-dependent oxidoreductase n=1 Tax=Shewanella sp. KT0246 TaxID=2815912 RepID=UPI001BC481F1|nr:SDR family NAD(P)-dependent oxidoreductase [Shewanella sp. KT0246]GIU51450.1 short-chain dehydrogenase [Shewanella sp. KT0246]